LVTYKYDAWGNWINKSSASNGTSLGDTLVIINPFIYKGYYYDKETDWYYLKSRYYSPLLS
jgi:RHS repeat-associated protein